MLRATVIRTAIVSRHITNRLRHPYIHSSHEDVPFHPLFQLLLIATIKIESVGPVTLLFGRLSPDPYTLLPRQIVLSQSHTPLIVLQQNRTSFPVGRYHLLMLQDGCMVGCSLSLLGCRYV